MHRSPLQSRKSYPSQVQVPVGVPGRLLGVALVALGAASSACSSGSTRSDFSDKPDGGVEAGTPSGPIGGNTPLPEGGTGVSGCSEAAKLVYVLSAENDLFSFAPDKLTFVKIGRLDCPAGGESPNSMAVDRSGTAWVNYSDGSLFKVSTSDATCSATSFQKGQNGFTRFGMAFASNSAGSDDETLYVSGIVGLNKGAGLASIDLTTMTLKLIGDYSGALKGQGAELSGSGDGRLFGFFTTEPDATLAEITKATGATTGDSSLQGVSTGSAWAFSFWGGDFWFYTADLVGKASVVTRKATSGTGTISTVVGDVGGFRVVGAGVSTCAPSAPPR